MRNLLQVIAEHASDISCIIALALVLIKPIREKLFGEAAIKEGQKCLLRSEIVKTYYRHLDHKRLRQYEYENLTSCYQAYKALGGNSFAEHIFKEMQDWEVLP